ncbi:hypothetical protein PROAA_1350004 [Candidatus Propionivibrio aalborgensis]|uniref:Uncharacterized protein n=1 Tax=Candidatus Propionivibrio aalborgensis TaxID=1860101 RepID=A0A1A8XHV7_9RHOO|nr:hypothetical protein PROAA_1350004 [Candidatus Propionivibrio aalborgensis]
MIGNELFKALNYYCYPIAYSVS